MPQPNSVAAIVLCGGRSVRMGRDKALLPIDEESFLERICRVARTFFSSTIVVAAEDQQLATPHPDVTIVRDELPDAGPLAGLLTGLQTLQQLPPECSHFWLTGCDAPFVSLPVIQRLLETISDDDAALVRVDDQIQPLGGIYRTDILPTVQQLVSSGERRLRQLPQHLSCQLLQADSLTELDPELLFLRNINTPEDYRRFVQDR